MSPQASARLAIDTNPRIAQLLVLQSALGNEYPVCGDTLAQAKGARS